MEMSLQWRNSLIIYNPTTLWGELNQCLHEHEILKAEALLGMYYTRSQHLTLSMASRCFHAS